MRGEPAWPVHPPPRSYEILRSYVTRLAAIYDVTYDIFCSNALGIPLTDREALSLDDASDEILGRLSRGVGVPVSELRGLTSKGGWARLNAELEQFLETPEGRQAFAELCGPDPHR